MFILLDCLDAHVYLKKSVTGTLGPRELGGSVDLIKQFKLSPYNEFFCKRPLPIDISGTRYLHNVVGKAKIEREGMELDQLFRNASAVENRHLDLHPFDMGILREAFKMRETTHADLSYAEKGTGRKMLEMNGNFADNQKHEKHKIRDKKKSKDHTCRHHQKDSATRKDGEKISKGHHDVDPNNLQKLQDKKRKFEGVDFSSIQRCQKTKLENLKVKIVGTLRIAH